MHYRLRMNFTSYGIHLKRGDDRFMVSTLAWALRKGHHLTPEMTNLIMWTHAFGVTNEMLRRVKDAEFNKEKYPTATSEGQQDQRATYTDDISRPLGMGEFEGAFFAYALGIGVAFVVFLLELATNKVLRD
jgi:hypothetical protein